MPLELKLFLSKIKIVLEIRDIFNTSFLEGSKKRKL